MGILIKPSLLWALLVLTSCDSGQQASGGKLTEYPGQVSLNYEGEPFALAIADVEGDSQKELLIVDHAANQMSVFHATGAKGQFSEHGPALGGVGFHPGNVIPWSTQPNLLVMGAEGDGKVRAFSLEPEAEERFRLVSDLPERSPRYVKEFQWPGWGPSLMVSPYMNGVLMLLKGYDPVHGSAKERIVVPLSQHANTLRGAGRVTVADLNGDGIDELILVFSAINEIMVVRYQPEGPPVAEVLMKNQSWGMPNEVQVIDFNGDGALDLLLPDETPPGQINVLINKGGMKFSEVNPIKFPSDQGILELRAGHDKDGLDYLLAAGPGSIALYQMPVQRSSEGPLPVREIPWVRQGDLTRDMRFEDIDGDGWLDIVMGRVTSKNNVWIAYGPLWDRFATLSEKGFKLQ